VSASVAKSNLAPVAGPDIENARALHAQGRLDEAEMVYSAILAEHPTQFDALNLLGLVRHQQGRAIEALQLIAAAVKLKPDSADALSNLGLAFDALQQHQNALASFEHALAVDHHHANALNNRGLTLATLGRKAEALASWDQALAADPAHLQARHNRGNALYNLKRHKEALSDYERVLAVQPDNLDVLNNRGGALAELGLLDEAFASYDRASIVGPQVPEVLINKGHVLADRHQFAEALKCYAAAAQVGRRPEAEWCASLVRLRLGQFAQGWRDYEWRWHQASWEIRRRNFAVPLWLGNEPIAGKTILLHAEQGFGDTLQFVRYLKSVADLGATVLLEVQPPLEPLLAGIVGSTRVLAHGEALPPFELHCPLMSLPLALGTIPAEVPYVHAPEERVARWRARLGERRSPRVGFVWAGSATHKNNHNRSMALERFASIFSAPGVAFVSLQNEVTAAEVAILDRHANLTQLGPELRDFADTAAVVAELDLVIAVDTAVVHVAGALGRPVWLLLPFTPDFRWLLDREDSPWYPTARLFRQPQFGDWESVLARVQHELGCL
jgi:tetratricopeptide (TPR) repeat protein